MKKKNLIIVLLMVIGIELCLLCLYYMYAIKHIHFEMQVAETKIENQVEDINSLGDFESVELVDSFGHLEIYYGYLYGDMYMVTLHNGEVDKIIQLN